MSYDSDSSDDLGEYTTTDVTLGYASIESVGDDVSHLGGRPSWTDNSARPPASFTKCKICNDYMALLVQLNADLQQHFPLDQRRLQVWCCRKRMCSKKAGSVRSFREVRKGKQGSRKTKVDEGKNGVEQKRPEQDLGSVLFGGNPSSTNSNGQNPFSTGANPFSTNGQPFGGLSSLAAKPPQKPVEETQLPTQSFADKLKISSKDEIPPEAKALQQTQLWPEDSAFPEPYPSFYLDAAPEELEPPLQEGPESSSQLQSQYELEEESASGTSKSGKEDRDAFESSLDKTFQKFSDAIAQNPEQVLRYEFKGRPLLYNETDSVASRFVTPHGKAGSVRGMPRCESCGAQRVFEMQLVPGLIYELEKDDKNMDMDDGMEWGTIIVGTCTNNCGEEAKVCFREEWTGVQWEERVPQK